MSSCHWFLFSTRVYYLQHLFILASLTSETSYSSFCSDHPGSGSTLLRGFCPRASPPPQLVIPALERLRQEDK